MKPILWILRGAKDSRNLLLSKISESDFFYTNVQLNCFMDSTSSNQNTSLKSEITFLKFSQKIADLFAFVRLWKYRERGISFLIRAHAFFSFPWERENFKNAEHNGNANQSLKVTFLVRFFALSIPFKFLSLTFNLCTILEKYRNSRYLRGYKVVVIPYEGRMDGFFDLLVALVNLCKINSFAIQSNWDNLSSKNFFYSSPTYFGVWGKQSSSHLTIFQRKPLINAIVLGNPRRLTEINQQNRSCFNQTLSRYSPSDSLVIFAGHGVGTSDAFILQAILDCKKQIGLEFNLLYRPHPFARHKIDAKALAQFECEGVKVSEETVVHENNIFIEKMQSSSLLISQMSTLCIEALELGIPVCVPTFSNVESDFSYRKAVDSLSHFVGVSLIPGLCIADSEFNLREAIQTSLTERISVGDVEWICTRKNFAEELISSLERMLNTNLDMVS